MKIYDSVFRPSTLMFAATGAIVAFYTISSNTHTALSSQELFEPRQHPRIQINDQPDSPVPLLQYRSV